MEFKNGVEWITLFQWMANNGDSLRYYGPAEPLRLKDPKYAVDRATVEALCDFGFLRRENGSSEGRAFTEFKLTDKSHRLLEVLKTRESADKDLVLNGERHFWIVVLNGNVFVDAGETPPNLLELTGATWNDGDRIVITCHDPRYVRVGDLRRALAAEVYGGLTVQEINEIEKIATDRSPAFRESRT